MSRVIIITFSTLLLMSFQCTKDDPDPIVEQDYLFAGIYTNNAWGENIYGWYIDNSGLIRGFSNQNDPSFSWNQPEEGGFISEEELNQNFIQSDTTYFRVEIPELFYNYELIPLAARGALTEEESGGADMGQMSYYCFTYDPEKDMYRFITLKSEGDWIIKNTAPEAAKMSRWLESIQNQL